MGNAYGLAAEGVIVFFSDEALVDVTRITLAPASRPP
jgi:hypothetical protein